MKNKEEVPKKNNNPGNKKIDWGLVVPVIFMICILVFIGFVAYYHGMSIHAVKQFCESERYVYDDIIGGKIICNEISDNFEITPHYYTLDALEK